MLWNFHEANPNSGTGGFKFYSPVSHGRCNLAARRSRPSWWHPRFEGQRRAGLSNDTAESMGFQEGDLGSAIAGATSSSCNSKIFQARRAWTRASVSSLPRLFFKMVHIYICQDLSRYQFPWRLCFSCSYPGGHLAKRFGACSSFQPSYVRTLSNHIGKTTYTSPNLIYNILQCPFWEVYLGSDHAIEESLNLNSAATATACGWEATLR